MKDAKLSILKELIENFREDDFYKERVLQLPVAKLHRDIIAEVIKGKQLTNEQLTGFIQIFKYGCSDSAFEKYMDIIVGDSTARNKLKKEAYKVNQWGYTAAGLNSISGLTKSQLTIVHKFLSDAFKVKTIEEAISLCTKFEEQHIPVIKKGIYSPWLHYINPNIFPVYNNSNVSFLKWLEIDEDYPSAIAELNKIKQVMNVTDLGLVDAFSHKFDTMKLIDDKSTQVLNLNGKKIYKVSHGFFKAKKTIRESGIVEHLEINNWICIHSETGKGGGRSFIKELKVGDFVYVCYGGNELYCIGKVISESMSLDAKLNKMINGDGKWVYREFMPLFYPNITKVDELKSDTKFFMPSGNSTVFEIPKDQFEYINKKVFIPKYNLRITDSENMDKNDSTIAKNHSSLNTILYGPPGTGKTFHSISHAVAIIENKDPLLTIEESNNDRAAIKSRYEKYVADGQIVFTTFHQSMGYEDFIEGIKPISPEKEDGQLSYETKDGIFKRLCTEAAFSYVNPKTSLDAEKALDFSAAYDIYVDEINERLSKEEEPFVLTRTGGKLFIESISSRNNINVIHEGGKKIHIVSKRRLAKLHQAFPNLKEVTNISSQFNAVIGGSNTSAYYAVLNEIKNQIDKPRPELLIEFIDKEYDYEDKKEIISALKSKDYSTASSKNYVLIIDEINRGNVSQIFGELITLIEDDKRLGKKETLSATLPYSLEKFGVPPNVHIIGTMNTADRSVEALDTALRRRFSFIPVLPQENILTTTTDRINLSKVLQTVNNRLRVLKDNDHTIGHAWFWNVTNLQQLRNIFANKILPLLQEYFYNDYEKLGLVLGDPFFKVKNQINRNMFAQFTGGNGLASQYERAWQFELKSPSELIIEDFKSLEIERTTIAQDEE